MEREQKESLLRDLNSLREHINNKIKDIRENTKENGRIWSCFYLSDDIRIECNIPEEIKLLPKYTEKELSEIIIWDSDLQFITHTSTFCFQEPCPKSIEECRKLIYEDSDRKWQASGISFKNHDKGKILLGQEDSYVTLGK